MVYSFKYLNETLNMIDNFDAFIRHYVVFISYLTLVLVSTASTDTHRDQYIPVFDEKS